MKPLVAFTKNGRQGDRVVEEILEIKSTKLRRCGTLLEKMTF